MKCIAPKFGLAAMQS